MQRENPIH